VRGHGDEPSVGDVAGHLFLRHNSAVELVDRAVAAGLLDRVTDGDDQRVVRLRLTHDGERKLAALSSLHLEELARLRATSESLWAELPGDGSSQQT